MSMSQRKQEPLRGGLDSETGFGAGVPGDSFSKARGAGAGQGEHIFWKQ